MKTLTASIALALTLAAPVAAQEVFPLGTFGAWDTDLIVQPDGSMACAMRSVNEMNDAVGIYASANVITFAMVIDVPSPGTFRADVTVDIDYQRFPLGDADFAPSPGGTTGIAFGFYPSDAVDFLTALGRGSALSLKSVDTLDTVATWSLKGTRSAIISVNECYKRISGEAL